MTAQQTKTTDSKAAIEVVLITGGASGMGRVFSQRMASQGMTVAVIDNNQALLDSVAASSVNIHGYLGDVSDLDNMKTITADVQQQFGPIDRVVSCAAIMPTACLAGQSADQVNKVMAINYGGTVNTLACVLPEMLARNSGEVIVFGSSGGYLGVPECGAYVATKFATNIYLETLIEENRDSDVHFMLVCPPLVDTPLLEQATNSSDPKMIRSALANKRYVTAEYIIDEIEKGLARNCKILIPGFSTKLMIWLRRLSPALSWWLTRLAD